MCGSTFAFPPRPDRIRVHADELVRLAPDVIAVTSLAATRALLQRTRSIPIVFNSVGDPVAGGLLKNIARPEGNATGITSLFQSLAGKWLELLKEAAPRVARVALIFNPGVVVENYFAVIDAAAEVLAVKAVRTPYRNAAELERAIDSFAAEPKLGWTEGRNLRIDVRFGSSDSDRVRAYAEELVSLAPDVIVTTGAAQTRAVQQRTQTIPIVFVQVGDPIASGVVNSIARPEGNTTGITNLFLTISGKWLELLKEAVPGVARVALIFDPQFLVAEIYVASIEAAATAAAIKTIRAPVHNTTEIEHAIDALAAEPSGGLIVVPPPLASPYRQLIFKLAVQHRLPVIVGDITAAEGGLMSYGPNRAELFRSGASYVDRILRGAKPRELPVQFPTRFELVVNLKAAKAIGLTIPESFLLRADEVIE
jgi:putative ABC transport system substrate-binding protein